jgi:acyltransferase
MPWIDHLKAFGIFLVVFGHSAAAPIRVETWIYSFHMPLFFLLSGILEKPVAVNVSFRSYFMRQARQLLGPYFLFVLLSYPIWFFVLRHVGEDTGGGMAAWVPLAAALYGTGSSPTFQVYPVPLWFFPCLFSSKLLLFAFVRFGKIWGTGLSIFLCGIGLFWPSKWVLPMEMDTAFVTQFFVVVGFLFARMTPWEMGSNLLRIGMGLVLLICGSLVGLENGKVDLLFSQYRNQLFFLISSVLMCIGCILLSSPLRRLKVAEWISKATVVIFPLHFFVFAFFSGVYVYLLKQPLAFRENLGVGLTASALNVAILTMLVAVWNWRKKEKES